MLDVCVLIGQMPGLATLAAGDDELKLVVVGGGLILAAIIVMLRTVRKVSETQERERTRREIAAYVAEGSITPQDAAQLLSAGMGEAAAVELARGVGQGVAWGTVSPKKAEDVVRAMRTPTGAMPPNQG